MELAGGLVWWLCGAGVVRVGGGGGWWWEALPCGHAVVVGRHRGQGQRIRGRGCRRYMCLCVNCV